MKFKFLLLAIICSPFLASAQFSVVDENGDAINNGDVLTVTTADEAEATINFFVTNDGSEAINSTIEYVSTNSDQSFQLCYGQQCYDGIQVGESYPPVNAPQVIAPGETTGPGNHFLYTGDELAPYGEFVFRFYTVDESGNEVGDDLTFTYVYDSPLSVGETETSLGVVLGSTVIRNSLSLESKDALHLNIYDLQGRLVQSQAIEAGRQELNVANLSAQMYIFNFINDKGVSQSFKVVKK